VTWFDPDSGTEVSIAPDLPRTRFRRVEQRLAQSDGVV